MTRRAELAAVTRLIDAFGPECDLVVHRESPRLSSVARARLRLKLETEAIAFHEKLTASEELRGRGGCTLNPEPHDPVLPYWSPPNLPRAGRIAVVGPAPDWRDHQHGELGWSRSERTLERLLRDCGLTSDAITWLTACWCWPRAGTDKHPANRSPESRELDVWHPWLLRALEAADVGYVLLHGSHAMRAWRRDFKLGDVAGGLYQWNERMFVTPIAHSSAVLRPDGIPMNDWRRDVAAFVEHVSEDVGVQGFGTACVRCHTRFYAWDGDGVPYCRAHFEQSYSARERGQKRMNESKARNDQGVLL